MKQILIILLAIVSLSGCAHSEPTVSVPPVAWQRAVDSWDGPPTAISEIVTGRLGDQIRTARFEIEFRRGRISMAAMTLTGVPLFQLVATPLGIEQSGQLAQNETLLPEWMLSDLVLAHWSPDSLKSVLASDMILKTGIDGEHSVFGADGHLIVTVSKLDSQNGVQKIRLQNAQFGYALAIEMRPPESIE